MEYYKNRYQVIAYVLMTNHVHIVIETKDKDVSDFIKRVHSRYASNFNKKYKYIGHLFQDRYGGELIKDDRYMLEVSRYVHLNPVSANMVEKPGEYKVKLFRWSFILQLNLVELIQERAAVTLPLKKVGVLRLLAIG